MMIHSDDVPFGTEVFVIVPDQFAQEIMAAKARLYDSLGREFPQFKFSLGGPVDGSPEQFDVLAVTGTVGDGWQPIRPFSSLDRETRADIVAHLEAFVQNKVDRAN